MNFEKVGKCIIINNKNFNKETGRWDGHGPASPACFNSLHLVLRLVSDFHWENTMSSVVADSLWKVVFECPGEGGAGSW